LRENRPTATRSEVKAPHLVLGVCLLGCGLPTAVAAERPVPVKVFLLAGQSNMEGKAPNALLEHQAGDPKTRPNSPTCARAASGSCATTCSSSSASAAAG
jgi:hypothetical protein